eukprot:TRINITY_DN8945_c0_g1_i2.p1 TRINITY_DN8945_c0_g1~~TRINITY_DN8945_c0_g1_i2.p1  ORF type:complete len:438 (+),score=77.54 TRINITY_DN8945_c0_g1_i2:47-1360(+)
MAPAAEAAMALRCAGRGRASATAAETVRSAVVFAGAAAPEARSRCRLSRTLPLRRPTPRNPKVHPATGLPLARAKGQHLLHNKGIVQKIVRAADLRSYDSVYEVGCGTGELTMALLPLARVVHTCDVEARMVQETEHRASAAGFNNIVVSEGDALKMAMPERFDVCVSNLPYQISSPFIFRLLRRLSEGPPWRLAVLMLQREFAERLLADPGEEHYSRLAIGVRLFARARRVFDVAPGSFVPAPQVHSTILRLEPRSPLPTIDFLEWDALIRLIFSRRRKTLHAQFTRLSTLNMLEQNYKMRCSLVGEKPSLRPFPEVVDAVLKKCGMQGERAFAMDIGDIQSLLRAFHDEGIHFANVHSAQRGANDIAGSLGLGPTGLADADGAFAAAAGAAEDRQRERSFTARGLGPFTLSGHRRSESVARRVSEAASTMAASYP